MKINFMTDQTIQHYKTTINCGSCVSKVQLTLDELVGEGNWNVDTTSPDKVLEINSPDLNEDELVLRLARLGYVINPH